MWPVGNLADAGYYVTDTGYSSIGLLQRVERATAVRDGNPTNAVWQTYSYEPGTNRLRELVVDRQLGTNNAVNDLTYSYEDAGAVIQIVDHPAGSTVTDRQCFQHDYLQRVTEAWTPAGGCSVSPAAGSLAGPAPYWLSWTYDVTGNRASEVRHTTGGDAKTTYGYAEQGPDAVQPHTLRTITQPKADGTTTSAAYDYDKTGNLATRPTASGQQTLTWDSEGDLSTITDPTGQRTSFVYDASGNRLLRRDPDGATVYLPGMDLRLTKATGDVIATRYYTHGAATVASRTPAELTWLAGDHQGTAQISLDAVSQKAAIRRQTPFGTARGDLVAWPNTRGFVGGENDPSGLVHLGARDYDPTLGRFISVDPIMDTTDPQQMNGYSYADNNPITISDPTGARPDCGTIESGGRCDNEIPASVVPAGAKGIGSKGWPNNNGGYNHWGRAVATSQCSGRFCVGAPRNPTHHGPHEDQFPYDPKVKPTLQDRVSRAKWLMTKDGCASSAFWGVGRCRGLIDGLLAYEHYWHGNGSDYEFDYEKAYREDPYIRADVDDEIAEMKMAADGLISQTGATSLQITGDPRNIRRNPKTENWQKALGSYGIWTSAEVRVAGGRTEMKVVVHAEDRYNFNKGASDLGSGVRDDVNGRFQTLGWARAFNSHGDMTRTVVWGG